MSISMHRRTVQVVHVVVDSTKPLEEVRRALEARVPQLDAAIPDLMESLPADRLLQRLAAAADLSIVLRRDQGTILKLYGDERRVLQYEIGNPLTSSMMTRYQLAAGLYTPLRIVLYEDESATRIEYDLPSSLFGQFGDDRVTAVSRELDYALLSALVGAAE